MAFKGCTISLNGTFANETHATLGNKIKINKGKYLNRLTNACTHLICNSADFEPNAAKVRQAATIPDIKIVSYEWLLKCIEGQKKEDEKKYEMNQSGDGDTTKKDTAGENKARSPTPVEDEIQTEENKDKQTAKGEKRDRSPTPVKSETPNKDEEKKDKQTARGKKRARSPSPVKSETPNKDEEKKDKQIGKRARNPTPVKSETPNKDEEKKDKQTAKGQQRDPGPTPVKIETPNKDEEKKDKQTAKSKKRARSPSPVKSETPNKDGEDDKPSGKKQKTKTTAKNKKRARSPTSVKAESLTKNEGEENKEQEEGKTLEKKQKPKKAGKGKKRAQSPAPAKAESLVKDEEGQKTEKPLEEKQKDGQKAKNRALCVPVDEAFAARSNGNYTVYIGDDGTIWDASLNQTVSGANKNKFYRIQILHNGSQYTTLTRWGRVGETGQQDTYIDKDLDPVIRFFEKKFKDKSGLTWANRLGSPRSGKYTFIERNYEESDDEGDEKPAETEDQAVEPVTAPESKLAKPVQSLMELIFNQQYFAASLNEMSYDAQKLPLGKLSKRTLMMGYEKLKALADLIGDIHAPGRQAAIAELSDAYYTVIPHVFGRNRPPVIGSDDRLKKEIALLESLSDMEIANALMKESKESKNDEGKATHPLDQQYSRLGMQEMTPLDSKSDEFKLLNQYLLGSSGQTHNLQYKVQDIFRIERNGENERFEKSPFANLKGDRRLLWHGSRCTNYGGILSQGLRIAPPEAPVSGYMFGKGVYLADVSSKSANYCCSYLSGNIGLLLLCEAEVGTPMLELTNASSSAAEEAKKKGCVATWGKGRIGPVGWKDAGCVHPNLNGVSMPDVTSPPGDTNVENASLYYNEYIVYDVAQVKLRYLLRVEIK